MDIQSKTVKNVRHGAKNVLTVHFSSIHYSSVQCSSVQCSKAFIHEARESNKHSFVCVCIPRRLDLL